MLKNPVFLCRVKIPYQQFLTFLSFMNIFRNSHSQVFFKTGALKNFAIFWIKEESPAQVFSSEYCKNFKNSFLQNFSSGCFCIFLKVIKQLFHKGYLFLQKFPCYDALMFSSRYVLERYCLMCLFTNLLPISKFSQ